MLLLPTNRPGLVQRPLFSLVFLVKLIAVITVVNTILTTISLVWPPYAPYTTEFSQPNRLELRRFPAEEVSADVIQGAKLSVLDSRTVFSRLENSAERNLRLSDIFVSVRTTNKYHRSRLKLLLDTWITTSPTNTWIFTDHQDDWLSQYVDENYETKGKPTTVYTDCPSSIDSRWALLCKMYWEYRTFLLSNVEWFCHFDDDSFVNLSMLQKLLSLYSVEDLIYIGRSPSTQPTGALAFDTENVEPEVLGFNATTNETDWNMPEIAFKRVNFHYALGSAGFCITRQLAIDMKEHLFGSRLIHTAASITMPDDCVVGYVITHRLNVSLIDTDLMHTHMEDLGNIDRLHKQVTLSYTLPTVFGKEASQSSDVHDRMENAENSIFFLRNSSKISTRLLVPRDTKLNVVDLKSGYSSKEDPTRFRSLHLLCTERQDNC